MIYLAAHDRARILVVIKTGSAREIGRGHCLNMRAKGLTVIEVAEFLEITPRTVINICTAYEEGGLERALHDDPRPGRPIEHTLLPNRQRICSRVFRDHQLLSDP